jgi:hypothetical protein
MVVFLAQLAVGGGAPPFTLSTPRLELRRPLQPLPSKTTRDRATCTQINRLSPLLSGLRRAETGREGVGREGGDET